MQNDKILKLAHDIYLLKLSQRANSIIQSSVSRFLAKRSIELAEIFAEEATAQGYTE